MKKFCEIKNFSQIEESTNYCLLKSLLFEANGIIYKYRQAYAFPLLVKQAKDEIIKTMQQISGLKLTSPKYKPQQEAILAKGRAIVAALTNYEQEFQFDESSAAAIDTSAKFQVRTFLQTKDVMTFSQGIDLLERNKLLYATIRTIEEQLSIKISIPSFFRLQDDIINRMKGDLDKYAFE